MILLNSNLLFLFVATACYLFLPKSFHQQPIDNSFAVLAYYVPEKTYQPDQLPLDQLTHIIFCFTKVIEGEMRFEQEGAGEKLQQLVAQKARHKDLKVMVACGGWTADGFSDMAYTDETRAKFIESAVDLVETYQLDGLDIDWEYPGIPAGGTKARKEDKQNFTLLMKELREALDALDRPQTLTFASAGWKPYYDNIELNQVLQYVDYMNIMTYDQVTYTSPFTAHHTNLGNIKETDLKGLPIMDFVTSYRKQNPDREWETRSVEKIVSYCIDQGADPKQLVVGAAFYGRAWKGVPPENNGLYQPNKGSYIGWSAYHQIREEFEAKNGYQRYWDSIAKAPYLYNPTDSIFITYDDTASVALKMDYVIDKQLGGIMFWELGNDTKQDHSLLDAIDKTKMASKTQE